MNKKTKKRIQVLRERLQKRRKQLAGVVDQPDEPGEAEKLEREIEGIKKSWSNLKKMTEKIKDFRCIF
jgi:phage shock protein A